VLSAQAQRARLDALALPADVRAALELHLELGEPAADPEGGSWGERIGANIRLRRHLRDGGAGAVHLGICEREMRPVAVKLLRVPRHEAGALALKQAWLREQQLLAELSPSGAVPRLLEAGEHTAADGARSLYLATEYKYGLDLARWCELHELGSADRIALFAQVCDAVSAIHAHGLVHGDLKPDNIQVQSQGADHSVWVLDLGLAAVQGQAWHGCDELIGTPGYMSPEQLVPEYGPVSEATDVYSLAMILFELLEGRPWLPRIAASEPAELAQRMLDQGQLRLTQVVPVERRDCLDEILARAAAWLPGARFGQVSALRGALQAALDRPGGRAGAGLRFPARVPGDECSPYRGLLAFEAAHAEWFFGRADAVERLLGLLRARPAVALIGASGSGKSSLVHAGLLPALRAGQLGAQHAWTALALRPGPRPLEQLALQLRAVLEPAPEPQALREPGFLARALAQRAARAQPAQRYLIVVDQLEELFAQGADPAEQRAFLAALLGAAAAEPSLVRVLFALRADFTAQALEHPELGELLQTADSQLMLGPLSQEGLRAAIEQPAVRAGLVLEPGLEQLLVEAVWGEPGSLPLLQFALDELWNRREGRYLTVRAYRAMGGLRGALAQRADAELAALEREGQGRAVRRLLLRLVQPGEHSADTRRRLVLEGAPSSPAELAAPLETLIRARLLTAQREHAGLPEAQAGSGGPAGQSRIAVELAHEALIREWGTLRRWIEEGREQLRMQHKLEQATRLWLESGERSDLWRTGRLSQASELWTDDPPVLSQDELAFLAASRGEVERLECEADAQRRRELAATQQLAAARAQEARRLRVGVALLAALVVALGGAASWAWTAQGQAREAIEAAIGAAESMLATVSRDLEAVSGAESVRDRILSEGAALLDRLTPSASSGTRERLLRSRVQYHQTQGDLDMSIRDLRVAREEYEAALAKASQLEREHPGELETKRAFVTSYQKLGIFHVYSGDPASARKAFEQALEFSRAVAQDSSPPLQPQRMQYALYIRLGQLSLDESDVPAARGEFQKAAAIAEQLLALKPGDFEATRDVFVSYSNLGRVTLRAGELEAAKRHYGYMEKIAGELERLAAQLPAEDRDKRSREQQAQADLLDVDFKLGDVALEELNEGEASARYQGALKRALGLAAGSTDLNTRRHPFVVYSRLGDLHLELGDGQAALGAYKDGVAITEKLAAEHSDNARVQIDAATGRNKLADAFLKLERFDEAQAYYERARAISQTLGKLPAASRSGATSMVGLGDVAVAKGDLQSALRHYREALAMAQQLWPAGHVVVNGLRDFFKIHYKLGQLGLLRKEFQLARESAERSVRLAKEALDLNPNSRRDARALAEAVALADQIERAACCPN
jgi:tetratricopeptide (TPR) repeat protein